MLTYGIIKGEAALNKYCMKRWGERPRFVETIGHVKECHGACQRNVFINPTNL